MIQLGGYLRNPVLVQVIGICPVAAAATSLVNSLVLSVVFTVSLILCEVIASLLLKKTARWIRVGIYIIIGAAVVFPSMFLLEKYSTAVLSGLGIYLPLMAMSSFSSVHCEKYAVKHTVKESFYDAVASSIGYCAVLLAVGVIREIIGAGRIAGVGIVPLKGLSGFLMPFGGMIVIGLLAAFHKYRVLKNNRSRASDIEKRFVLDESTDEEGTFTYAVKNRFRSQK